MTTFRSQILSGLICLAVIGCGDGQGGSHDDSDGGGPLFAVPTEIYSADSSSSTSYVPVVSSLDVSRIELNKARELNGRATMAVVGDWLFLASSSAPIVERFRIASDGSLKSDGRLSFANHGVPEFFAIDPWGAVFVSAEKAYIFNGNDGSHVVWNPTTMEITGEIPGPDIAQEGYQFESIAIVQGNRMYRVFTLLNYDTWEFLAAPQYLAVYDVDTDELVNLVEETRCPQLYSRPFVDESGDIYFSNFIWTPALSVTGDYPKSCALRVKHGAATFDPDFQLNFADITDGREAGILRYLGNGRALLDVFHAERATIDANTDPQELANTSNWRLWSVDLGSRTGAPLDGFDFKAAGYQDVAVDTRTFLMVPNEDYSETTSYEVVSGDVEQRFKIQGSSYFMARVR
jgi:hypothetical protein